MDRPRRIVLGVHTTDRVHHTPGVQDLLTEYGRSIKTRLGVVKGVGIQEMIFEHD